MIGYVRDSSSIGETLMGFLSKADESHPEHFRLESLPVPVDTEAGELAYSRHGRKFVYGNQLPPNSPGSISIWHLWLG